MKLQRGQQANYPLAERELQAAQDVDVAELDQKLQPHRFDLEQLTVKSRKSDNQMQPVAIAWTPWFVNEADQAMPGFGPLDSNAVTAAP